MIKIDDLAFESASCCGSCLSASATLDSGEIVGILRRDDGLFDLSFYNDKGLIRRSLGMTAQQVEAIF